MNGVTRKTTILLLLSIIVVTLPSTASFVPPLPRIDRNISPIRWTKQQHQQHKILTNFLITQHQPQTNNLLCLASHPDNDDIDDESPKQPARSQRKRRVFNRIKNLARSVTRKRRIAAVTLAAASSVYFRSVFGQSSPIEPAHAKFSYELSEEKTFSIRPGMTKSQADDMMEGNVEDLPDSGIVPGTTGDDESGKIDTTATAKAPKKQKKKTDVYGDIDHDEYDFDDFDDDDDDDNDYVRGSTTSVASSSTGMASQSSKVSQFATYKQEKTTGMYVKAGVMVALPFGGMCAREFVRRRKEEAYVQKGLEILEEQKKEYFKETGQTPPDEDDDEDDDDDIDDDDDDPDDDDDDDDDDDEDNDDDSPPPRRPRRPLGDGGGGGGGGDLGGAGGGDTGSGKVSQQDIDKLKNMFKNS